MARGKKGATSAAGANKKGIIEGARGDGGLYVTPAGMIHAGASLVGQRGIYINRLGPSDPETETANLSKDPSFGKCPSLGTAFFSGREQKVDN